MRPMHLRAYLDAMEHQWSGAVHDLPALADFVVVADLQHMTRAAEVLGVPQSTLSRRVGRLEAALGVPLLVRRGRRIEVTRAGATLAATARRALADVDRAVVELAEDHDPRRGVVTLAFLHTLGPVAVPGVIREFRRTFPDVRFELVQEAHHEVLRHLRAGEVDVALTAPLPTGPDVASFALLEQRLCAVVPADHPLATRSGVALATLAEESFVGFKPGYGLRQITDEWCAAAGFAPRLTFEGDDVATVRGLVAAGLGIALLPGSGVPGRGDVVEVDVRRPRRTRTIGVAWPTGRPLPPPARSFRDFLLERGAELLAAADR